MSYDRYHISIITNFVKKNLLLVFHSVQGETNRRDYIRNKSVLSEIEKEAFLICRGTVFISAPEKPVEFENKTIEEGGSVEKVVTNCRKNGHQFENNRQTV